MSHIAHRLAHTYTAPQKWGFDWSAYGIKVIYEQEADIPRNLLHFDYTFESLTDHCETDEMWFGCFYQYCGVDGGVRGV